LRGEDGRREPDFKYLFVGILCLISFPVPFPNLNRLNADTALLPDDTDHKPGQLQNRLGFVGSIKRPCLPTKGYFLPAIVFCGNKFYIYRPCMKRFLPKRAAYLLLLFVFLSQAAAARIIVSVNNRQAQPQKFSLQCFVDSGSQRSYHPPFFTKPARRQGGYELQEQPVLDQS
jgi:hypothetical protein